MTNKGPIEIRPDDVIRRPPGGVKPPVSVSPLPPDKEPGFFDQVKDTFQNIKELKKMADEFGLKIPGVPGGRDMESGDERAVPSQKDQIRMAVQLLRVKYGDVTVKQLIEKLLAEYGDRRLSSF